MTCTGLLSPLLEPWSLRQPSLGGDHHVPRCWEVGPSGFLQNQVLFQPLQPPRLAGSSRLSVHPLLSALMLTQHEHVAHSVLFLMS